MTNIELDISNLDKWDLLDIAQVLTAYAEDKMSVRARNYFNPDTKIHLGVNTESETVYLYDAEYNTLVYHVGENKLVLFLTCPECDNEETEFEYNPKDNCTGCRELVEEFLLEPITCMACTKTTTHTWKGNDQVCSRCGHGFTIELEAQ